MAVRTAPFSGEIGEASAESGDGESDFHDSSEHSKGMRGTGVRFRDGVGRMHRKYHVPKLEESEWLQKFETAPQKKIKY